MAEPVSIPATQASPSLWDRVSNWAAEHKAIAYTIAGTVVVITSAGAIYYFSSPGRRRPAPPAEKRKSKKERRKEKKQAEEEQAKAEGITLKDTEAGKACRRCDARRSGTDRGCSCCVIQSRDRRRRGRAAQNR